MDVSVTNANLKDAAVQIRYKPATDCSVLVQWSMRNLICSIMLRADLSPWLRANWGQSGRAGGKPAPRDKIFNLCRWRNTEPTGEAREESEATKTEEAAGERRKSQRKSLPERTPWEVLCQWDPKGDQGRGAGCCHFGKCQASFCRRRNS